jgi:hypothetical protein
MERLQRASDVFCADACFVDRIDKDAELYSHSCSSHFKLNRLRCTAITPPIDAEKAHIQECLVKDRWRRRRFFKMLNARRWRPMGVDFRPLAGQSKIPDRMQCDDISISTRWW